jgi:UDP-N-acetylglucosamine transferase subunit ALG13
MVQKNKLLGKPLLVFVTVGTTPFKFDRLFQAIDEAALGIKRPIKLIIQQGESDHQWRYPHVEKYKYLPPNKLINFIKKADKIITHASYGILYFIYKYSKVLPLIVARIHCFNEQVSDHQVFFLKYILKYKFKDSIFPKLLFYSRDSSLLTERIDLYLNENYINKNKYFLFAKKNGEKIINRLLAFINSYLK